jgi:3-oxoacyl-[acyl-carrier protein] reductase
MDKQDLTGKNILITGASRGIGRSVAVTLASEGAFVLLTGRSSSSLEETASIIRSAGGKALCLTADFSNQDAVFQLASEVKRHISNLDVLINNAGQALSAPVGDTTTEDWDRIMTVNARSPYFLSQQLLPLMAGSSLKTIVNIASVVSTQGYPLQSAYSASKHALIGFSKSMARELQDQGYRVHVISPGGVATDMVTRVRPDINQEELIQPDEIAQWILFLLNHRGQGMVDHIQIRRESKLPW